MKILLIGLIAFFAWTALSTYLYVCKIKGLCIETVAVQMSGMNNDTMATDTLQNTKVTVELTAPNDLIIYFAFDKSEFSSNSIIEKYFKESNAYFKQNDQVIFEITGHTDAIGTNSYNEALGYRRAQSVQHYFMNKGLHENAIKIKSEGESKPVDNNNTKEGRAKNRRTVITIK